MNCLHCNSNINFNYHILRNGIQPNSVIGYGDFCSVKCALEKLRTENHGDSDYYNSLCVMKNKYWNDEGVKTFYEPIEVREIKPLLEEVEEILPTVPRYQVKKASKVKKSTNDIIKNEFFTGKGATIMTGKNLCLSK